MMPTDNQYAMPRVIDSRLRWRCRRGMLELDILLNGFIEHCYLQLDEAQKSVLNRVLDYPDQLLFDLLLGHMPSSDPEVADLVQFIRQSPQL